MDKMTVLGSSNTSYKRYKALRQTKPLTVNWAVCLLMLLLWQPITITALQYRGRLTMDLMQRQRCKDCGMVIERPLLTKDHRITNGRPAIDTDHEITTESPPSIPEDNATIINNCSLVMEQKTTATQIERPHINTVSSHLRSAGLPPVRSKSLKLPNLTVYVKPKQHITKDQEIFHHTSFPSINKHPIQSRFLSFNSNAERSNTDKKRYANSRSSTVSRLPRRAEHHSSSHRRRLRSLGNNIESGMATLSIQRHEEKPLPEKCPMSWSCAERLQANDRKDEVDNLMRFPCHCDEDCLTYGDCCFDYLVSKSSKTNAHKEGAITPGSEENKENDKTWQKGEEEEEEEENENLHSKFPPTVTDESWTCRSLVPPIHRPYVSKKGVYMVTKCPTETPLQLSNKCNQISTDTDTLQYLMDIPVVSANSGIVYANVFCARCHKEFKMEPYSVNVACPKPLESLGELASMTYHPGELMWSKKLNGQKVVNDKYSRDQSKVIETMCLLDVVHGKSVGRNCELELIKTCKDGWTGDSVREQCSSYNYYVEVGGKTYTNWHCAICNKEKEGDISCLSLYHFGLRAVPPPSLSDLFRVKGQCEENQVWDLLYNKCENVTCGSLFTLTDGECVRNNKTIEDGESYLNSSCYTHEFQREYSVMFNNRSVYLNHTKKTYGNGEYEFVNHTWIKVCRPEGRWTPVMNIISTLLISISLLFMAIHMIIFCLLPKRRNIPSMNLFSMTFSLFVTELVFVSFFYLNENYAICVLIGVVIYYFLSASFMWMSVMSIDICRTFHSNTYKTKSKKIFIQYSVYAWTIPMMATIIALLTDQFASPDFILIPGFGTDRCWFNNKWGLVTFFTLPSGMIVLINLGLYGVSVFDIYKQHKSGEFASSTIQKNGSARGRKNIEKEKEKFVKSTPYREKDSKQTGNVARSDSDSPKCTERFRERIQRRIHAHKKQRVRLVLYTKLALIMGLTWIFAFISLHTESIIFEYLFIVFNGLQGTFIFIAFDCKQKLWEELWLRVTGRRIQRQGTGTSTSHTKDTSLSSSTSGHYRYRWASSMNQDGSRKFSPLTQGQGDFSGQSRNSSEREAYDTDGEK